MENLLEISNLTKKYGHEKILSDLNLSIPKNSIIGLIGENGSGKTTLMKCISDIIPSYRKNFLIQNWMRNRNTLEFIGLLESLIIQILTVCNSTRLEMNLV
uniref:ATP-binding cassette domain-containing protein n=1 Tax=Sneathia vaginalis TaxID=187101 RepID=UPI0040473681